MRRTSTPKLSEIQGVVLDIITDAFTGIDITIVEDNGLRDDDVEKALREKGSCIIIAPVIRWTTRDQDGPSSLCDAEILVKVYFNPKRNSEVGRFDIIEICSHVSNSLCLTPKRSPGSEFFKTAKDAGTLAMFDAGTWTYDLLFTKETII